MADLDDFFAKKDRKKGKTVKKFSTAEEIVKKIEDTKVKNEIKVKKDRQLGPGQEGEDVAPMPGDEDEWREYEVAKKDYTGLKIQPLTGQEAREGQGGPGDGEGGQGGGIQGGAGRPGPWNKNEGEGEEKTSGPQERAPVSSLPPPVAPPAPAPSSAGGVYVAPSLLRNRAKAQSAQQDTARPTPRGMKLHAPDIHSEEYFPTLGGAEKGAGARAGGGGAWTEAGGGGGAGAAKGPKASAPVALGNRFTSLTNDS